LPSINSIPKEKRTELTRLEREENETYSKDGRASLEVEEFFTRRKGVGDILGVEGPMNEIDEEEEDLKGSFDSTWFTCAVKPPKEM
jgi:hypothetical protein